GFGRIFGPGSLTERQERVYHGSSPSAGANETINQWQDAADFGPVAIDVASGQGRPFNRDKHQGTNKLGLVEAREFSAPVSVAFEGRVPEKSPKTEVKCGDCVGWDDRSIVHVGANIGAREWRQESPTIVVLEFQDRVKETGLKVAEREKSGNPAEPRS